MVKGRKEHRPSFRARVALEARKGGLNMTESAGRYQVHPGQIQARNKVLLEGAVSVADGANGKRRKGD